MHGNSDQIHIPGDGVVICEQDVDNRAIAVIADIVRRDPFLIDYVSYGVRSRVHAALSEGKASFPYSNTDCEPELGTNPRIELPSFLTSAAGRICPDLDLERHLETVGLVGYHIASAMGLDGDAKDRTRLAGRLHDLGKCDKEMHELAGSGKLPRDRKVRIKLHPLIGARVSEYFQFPGDVTDLVLNHHFRCDGTGYPMQNGAPISPEIAALSVADALDAMVNARPERPPISISDALQEIRNKSGTHFHPDAVTALSRVALRRIYG